MTHPMTNPPAAEVEKALANADRIVAERPFIVQPSRTSEDLTVLAAALRAETEKVAKVWSELQGLEYDFARQKSALTASEARADAAEKEREEWRQRYFTARDALHPLKYPPDPRMLRSIADEIDCNPGCERGYAEHDTNAFVCSAEDRGECGWAKAEELRAFAAAVETRAALAPAPGEAG